MKKYVMVAMAAFFMFSTVLVAQEQNAPKHERGEKKEFKQNEKRKISPEKRAEFMAKQLDLSDGEKAKVQALFEKQNAKHKQQMEEMKKMREEQKAKFEAEKKSRDAELIKIIGNEKFQELQAMQIEHLKKMNKKQMHKPCPNCDQQGPKLRKEMMKKHMLKEKEGSKTEM